MGGSEREGGRGKEGRWVCASAEPQCHKAFLVHNLGVHNVIKYPITIIKLYYLEEVTLKATKEINEIWPRDCGNWDPGAGERDGVSNPGNRLQRPALRCRSTVLHSSNSFYTAFGLMEN